MTTIQLQQTKQEISLRASTLQQLLWSRIQREKKYQSPKSLETCKIKILSYHDLNLNASPKLLHGQEYFRQSQLCPCKLNSLLNGICRIITSCLKPTNISMHVFAAISLPHICRPVGSMETTNRGNQIPFTWVNCCNMKSM